MVKHFNKGKSCIVQKRARELAALKRHVLLTSYISHQLATCSRVWSAKKVHEEVQKLSGVKVPLRTVMHVLKKNFKLSFRSIKRVSSCGDSDSNKVLRSLFAQKMLQLYAQSTHVVNIDESWIPCSDFRRSCWGPRGASNSMHDTALSSRVNVIVAVSSEGHVWLALT